MSRAQLAELVGCIGDTPLVTVALRGSGRSLQLHLKLEACNPGGSIKDRTALSLIESAEASGRLSAGATLIESTSGNLGVALAYLAKAKGYSFHAVLDRHATMENARAMLELDAAVEVVTTADADGSFLPARLARVAEISRLEASAIWVNQYENPANPLAHEIGTARELVAQTREPDAVFVPVSTGGTLAGIAAGLHFAWPSCTIVAVDALGSRALGVTEPGVRTLPGLGSAQQSHFVCPSHYDRYFHVGEIEAVACAHAVWRGSGIKLGGSGGAAVAAAARLLSSQPAMRSAVCICPDDGRKYDASIYDRRWLQDHGMNVGRAVLPLDDVTAEHRFAWSELVASNSWPKDRLLV